MSPHKSPGTCPVTQNAAMSDVVDQAERRFAVITDEAVEQLRRLIGVPIVDTVEPWCYEATRDNIRHYAHGIGDDNPLWCDPDYAAGTAVRHGDRPAELRVRPDRSCRATSAGCRASTRCGPAPTSRGTRRSLATPKIVTSAPPRRPRRARDPLRRSGDPADLPRRHRARPRERSAQATRGASAPSATRRARRARSTTAAKQRAGGEVHAPSSCRRSTRSTRPRRSAAPSRGSSRTLQVGDELPTMAKGPMTVTGFIAFAQGWGGLYIRANKLAYDQIKRHPGLGIPNRRGDPRRARAGPLGGRPGDVTSGRRAPTTTGPSGARG